MEKRLKESEREIALAKEDYLRLVVSTDLTNPLMRNYLGRIRKDFDK